MIDPAKVAFFVPAHLKKFKLELFNRIGRTIERAGGIVIRGDFQELAWAAEDHIPIVGCTPELRPLIDNWQAEGRPWIYWDRGYFRRVFATDLPTGDNGGFYRWHVSSYQMKEVRDLPEDRWKAALIDVRPWQTGGRHIVVAEPSDTYQRFHRIEGWTEATLAELKKITDRPIVVRDKEMQRSGRKLHQDLAGAHCLVTHGSNAAVESVIMGCPVFVDASSAAALVGKTDLNEIEEPAYPGRKAWCHSLACSQFNERELVDGTLWKLLT